MTWSFNSFSNLLSTAYSSAAKVMAVVKNEHLLLCTLLTGKSLAMAVCHAYIHCVSLYSEVNWF